MSHAGVMPPAATAELAGHILSRSCPFERLLIQPTATVSEANNAFRQLSLLWHPDKCKHLPQASEVFKALTEAVQAVRRLRQHTDQGAHRHPRQGTEQNPWWAAYADPAPAAAAAETAAGGAAAPSFPAQATAAGWANRAGGSAWARGTVPAPAAAPSGPSTAGGPVDGTEGPSSYENAAHGKLSSSPNKGNGSGAEERSQPHHHQLRQQQQQPNTASAWWSKRPGGMGATAGGPVAEEPPANPRKRRTRGSEQLEAARTGRQGGAKPEEAAEVVAAKCAADVADAPTTGAKKPRVKAGTAAGSVAAQPSGGRRAVPHDPLGGVGGDTTERSSPKAGQGGDAREQVGRSQAPSSGFEAGASAWGAAGGQWLRRPVFLPTVLLAEGGPGLQPQGRRARCSRRASGSQDDIEDDSGAEGRVGGAGRSRGGLAETSSGDGSSGGSDSDDAPTSEEVEHDDDAFEAPQHCRHMSSHQGLGMALVRPASFYGATAAATAHAGGAPAAAPQAQSGGGSGWAAGCGRSRAQPLVARLGVNTADGVLCDGSGVCGDGDGGGLGGGCSGARRALRSRLQKQGASGQERPSATRLLGILGEPAAAGHHAGELEREQQGEGAEQRKGCSAWWQHLGPATATRGGPHQSEPRGTLGPGAAGLCPEQGASCRAVGLPHGSQEWSGAEGEGQAGGVARACNMPGAHAGEQGRCGQPADVPTEDRQEEEGYGQDDEVHYGDEYDNAPRNGWEDAGEGGTGVGCEQDEGDVPYDDAGWDAADEAAEGQAQDGDVWWGQGQEPRSQEACGSGSILDAFLTQVRQDGELNAQRAGQERIVNLRKAAFQNKFRGGGRGRGGRGKVCGRGPAKAERGAGAAAGAGAVKRGGGGAGGGGRGRGAAGRSGGSSAVGILRFATASAVR